MSKKNKDDTYEALFEEMEKLFDQQIKRLKARGCPYIIYSFLEEQKRKVIETLYEDTLCLYPIPFLPIVPFPFVSFYSQLDMIRYKGRKGYSSLNPTKLIDLVEIPSKPYYAFGIKIDGARGNSAVASELVALCIHNIKFLPGKYLYALASRQLVKDDAHYHYPLAAWVDSGNNDINFDYLSHGEDKIREKCMITVRFRKSFSSTWSWEN